MEQRKVAASLNDEISEFMMNKRFTLQERIERLERLATDWNLRFSEDDRAAIQELTWCPHWDGKKYLTFRAKMRGPDGRMNVPVKLHRFIMFRMNDGNKWSSTLEVMHIDFDVTNVRRENLALGTHRCNGAKRPRANRAESVYPSILGTD